jgi:CRISPR-associated exonuclease Cas4
MSYLLVALLSLLVVAAASYMAARRAAKRTRLPAGEIIYSDTGFPVGRIGAVHRNREGIKQEKPLISRQYGLIGRPDYLVRTDEGIIPVEAKSTRCPPNGRAYDSHIMQLAAYCLLVEDVLGAEIPYGIIRYADREVFIDYTPELREDLLALLEEMREARTAEEVHRDHTDARRCSRCGLREVCDESLA